MGRYTPGPACPPHLKIHILTPQKETCHFCQNWNNEKAKVMLLTRKVYANSAEVAATFPQTQLAAESHRGRGAIATAKEEAEFHSNAPAISTAKEEAKLHSNAPVVSTGKVEVKTPQQRSSNFHSRRRGQNFTATLQQFPQTQLAATSTKDYSNAPAISTAEDEPKTPQQRSRNFHSKSRGKNSTATLLRFLQQKRRQNSTATLPLFLQEK